MMVATPSVILSLPKNPCILVLATGTDIDSRYQGSVKLSGVIVVRPREL